MKRSWIAFLLALALIAGLLPQGAVRAEAATFSWKGWTPISTEAELRAIEQDMTGNYYLTGNITLSDGWMPIGMKEGGNSISGFLGILDGNGYTIRNLTMGYSGVPFYHGLFGAIGTDGIVRNLTVELDTQITVAANASGNTASVGGIAGTSSGQILNCTTSGTLTVKGDACYVNVGGIAGAASGYIELCDNYATVIFEDQYTESGMSAYVGGIAGNCAAELDHCKNYGTVSALSSSVYVGGISAYQTGSISGCDNTGSITGTTAVSEDYSEAYVGGICGEVSNHSRDFKIQYCRNTGAVSAAAGDWLYLGGLVGQNATGSSRGPADLDMCSNTGTVTGTCMTSVANTQGAYVGGLLGSHMSLSTDRGYIHDCYNQGTIYLNRRNSMSNYQFYNAEVGGLIGSAGYIDFYRCYNLGGVSVYASYKYIGGIIGCDYGRSSTYTDTNYYHYGSYAGVDQKPSGGTANTTGALRALSDFQVKANFPNYASYYWTVVDGAYPTHNSARFHNACSLTGTKATEPGCTSSGRAAYWRCSLCGNTFRDQGINAVNFSELTVPATGHIAAAPVVENEKSGDCKTRASYESVVYCAVCKTHEISRTTVNGDFGDHAPAAAVVENEKDGDCKNKASYDSVVYCDLCDEELSRETVYGAYGDHVPAAAVPEHEKPGDCKNPFTCESVVYCELCEEELSRTPYVGELGDHVPAEPVKENVQEGDCKTQVSYESVVYCAVCKTHEISRTTVTGEYGDHVPAAAVVENEKKGDCKTKASYESVVYCDLCDEELSRDTVYGEYGDHAPAAAVVENEKKGDCKTKASYDSVVYCDLCDEELSRETVYGEYGDHAPAAAVVENEKSGDCKTKASYESVVYCDLCDEELSRETVYGEYGDHAPAAAVVENEKTGDCKTKASHDSVVYCDLCDEELSRDTVYGEYGNHAWGDWTEAGDLLVRTCATCGETEEKEGEHKPVTNPFKDVDEKAFYYEGLLWALENKVTSGTSETTFEPGATCTRGQVVTFLWRAMGQPKAENRKNPFKDVKSDAFYYEAVLWAVEQGITKGVSDTEFGPNDPCTRGHVVTFLHRTLKEPAPGSDANPFADVKKGTFYYNAVLWAVEMKVTTGTGATTFSPNDPCTRGQIVTFLHRALK